MVPELIARVDGLPVALVEPERIWPEPASSTARSRRVSSARRRARVERQTAAVHDVRLPRDIQALIDRQAAEQERLELRAELAAAGLL